MTFGSAIETEQKRMAFRKFSFEKPCNHFMKETGPVASFFASLLRHRVFLNHEYINLGDSFIEKSRFVISNFIFVDSTVVMDGRLPLEKFHRWLEGTFVCRKCGREFHIMSLGFGEAICPGCYNGENPFIFLDGTFWLNRIMAALIKRVSPPSNKLVSAPEINHRLDIPPEIEAPNQQA